MYVAQIIPQIDVEIVEKDHFGMETSLGLCSGVIGVIKSTSISPVEIRLIMKENNGMKLLNKEKL